ncbi:MAG: porin [Planctomycetota bacterium]|nr:porin [Planctomycetota bacterium]
MMRICKVLGCVLILSLAARASESDQEERMRKLEDMVQRQQEQLQSMQQKLGEKDRDLVEAEKRIKALETMQTTTDQSIERILERKTYFAPSAAEGKSDNTFKVFWKEGLRLETADKQFKLAIGGRVQYDYVFPWEDARISDSLGEQEVFTEFRRARLGVSGTLYNNFIFKGEYDFSDDGDGSTEFKDVYMGLTNLPGIGTAKFGNQFEPFSLEEQTSSKYTTFMERGAIENVFTPGRNPGMRLENSHLDDRLYWALGVFRLGNVDGESSKDDDADVIVADDDGNFRPSDGQANWRFDGRIVGLPWWEEDGQKMVHLGLAYMYHMHPSRTLRHRARPEVHTFTQVLDTGTFTADDSHIFGAELAMVYDSWSLQAEYMARWDNRDIGLFTDDPGAPPRSTTTAPTTPSSTASTSSAATS